MNTQTTISLDGELLARWRETGQGSLSALVARSMRESITRGQDLVSTADIPFLECAACKTRVSIIGLDRMGGNCPTCKNEAFKVAKK